MPTAAILIAALLGALGAGPHAAPRQGASIRQRLAAVLAAEESRAATPHQLETLAGATRDRVPEIQAAAARALGRLERRDAIPFLLPLLASRDERVRSEAANAIAQSLRDDPPAPGSAASVEAVLDALRAAPRSDGLYRAVGRLPYETAGQVRAAEALLRDAILSADPPASAARGLESLGRRRPRLAPLEEDTIERLRELAGRRSARAAAAVRRNAMLALVAWQAVDAQTVAAALDDEEFEIRRLAALVLAGAGSAFTPEERVAFLNKALRDRAPHVRLEAIRSWARRVAPEHGCVPLVTALSDPDRHVVIAALDALGDQCRDDESITERLAAEARTPPARGGAWQREAHAFLALARRSRERAAYAMPSFASHDDWAVRLYAVRAAAAMDDVATLQRLAADPDDNVVEATLAPLRKRLGAESDGIFIAALNRRARTSGKGEPARPYQVYREAARQLKGALGTGDLLAALLGALQRASADRCDTSRDARLELLARIAELGSSVQVPALAPLLRDSDPAVAAAAASAIEAWTGRRPAVEPPHRQPELPPLDMLFDDDALLAVRMENGRAFRMAFYSEQAPLAKARIVRLAGERFYDGLTFHRVVPNFVIQGGSPNANEYCGDCPYMRDEVGLQMHVRGTVGISTRGRDTGDAQIFVNLVDSPRLDHEYTVFAYVCPADMPVVDGIQEGDRMTRVSIVRGPVSGCPPPR